jgi:hypothetical protein
MQLAAGITTYVFVWICCAAYFQNVFTISSMLLTHLTVLWIIFGCRIPQSLHTGKHHFIYLLPPPCVSWEKYYFKLIRMSFVWLRTLFFMGHLIKHPISKSKEPQVWHSPKLHPFAS